MSKETAETVDMREIIRCEVADIQPFDTLEHEHQADVLTWIDSGADLFRVQKPDVPPKHLVSYFMLYDGAKQSVLLMDHKKSGLWLPSGGHVEPNENPRTTVERECDEELSIPAKFIYETPLFLTVTQTIGQNLHTDVSLWYILSGQETMDLGWDTREFNQVRWWPLEEIQTKSDGFDPHMQRFVAKLAGHTNE